MSSFSVFVGNIAPNVAEEDLVDLFSQVGRVRAARLARDKETGRAKQFGFIDFDDHETCLSAMRNLNGADLKGRPLRVDVASNKPVDRGARGGGPQQGGRPQQGGAPPPRGGQERRPSSPPRDKAAEAWARMLGELPEERVTVMHEGELWQLVSNAQPLVATDVDAARRALVAKPTAALALLRAQIRLGMVSGQAISAVMAREQQQQQQQQHQAQYQQQQQQQQQQYRQHAGPPPGHYPPHMQQQQQQQQQWRGPPQQQHRGPPPGGGWQQQPPQHYQQQQPRPGGPLNPQQAALLQQVQMLTPQQIDALPPQQRAQLQQLRAQFNL